VYNAAKPMEMIARMGVSAQYVGRVLRRVCAHSGSLSAPVIHSVGVPGALPLRGNP